MAGLANGGCIASPEKGEGCQEFGLSAKGHVLLPGHNLKGEKRVLGILSGLPLGTDFDKLADGEEGAKGHYQDDQNQRKEELPA